jgi:hypothetical protein
MYRFSTQLRRLAVREVIKSDDYLYNHRDVSF